MKLSIIIPVYNGAEFLQKSYASIMNQHLDDYEIVYVDNNSKDDSVKIIELFKEKNKNVKLYFQTRQGEAQTRNKGIEKAQADYIHQLDVDDELFPDTLKKMMDVLDSYPNIEAVFGKMVKSHNTIANTEKPDDETNNVTLKDKPYWGLKWFSDLSSVVGEAAYMHRKSVFKKNGLYTEQLPLIGTDLAFDVKLGMTCNVAFIDTYIYLYFKHETSLIQGVKQKTPRAFMMWPRLVKEHLPFYLNTETPVEFKKILHAQLFKSMGKQLYFTKGYLVRKQLKQKLLAEIIPLEVSRIITLFLSILVILPFSVIIKFYGYYVVPYIKKSIVD
jgi:glycosyltransferase involved in cell wall biosynthesis